MKYNILTEPNIQLEVCYFKCTAWAWGPYIERYEGRLLMACDYDAENQLIHLAFVFVEKNREN
jgi:hypothetical protein